MLKRLIKKIRDFVIGDYRSKILGDLIVKKIIKYNKQKNIRILDFGSGFQPNIIFYIYDKLTLIYKKKVFIDCFDFYTLNQLSKLNGDRSVLINFKKIKLMKQQREKYDFALINDVLHHIGIEKKNFIINLLNDILNKSKIIFVKDHFQYGYISNQLIRIMDYLGNCFNTNKLPKIYYTKKLFQELIKKTDGHIIEIIYEIKLYPSYLLFMSNPKLNFVCLIKKD